MTKIVKVRVTIACVGLLAMLACSLILTQPRMTTPSKTDSFAKTVVQRYGKLL